VEPPPPLLVLAKLSWPKRHAECHHLTNDSIALGGGDGKINMTPIWFAAALALALAKWSRKREHAND